MSSNETGVAVAGDATTAAAAAATIGIKGINDFLDAPSQPVDIEACELGEPINGTVWIAQKSSSNGLRYFYNTATKSSTWNKPEALMTVRERLLAQCVWKEHVSDEGKKYYFNSKTGESLWSMPAEYRECLDKAAAAERDLRGFIQRETAAASSGDAHGQSQQSQSRRSHGRVTRDEAVRLFKELLAEKFPSSTTTWDRVVKEASDDPRFTALRSLNERKNVFSDWVERQRDAEVAERKDRIWRVKEDFIALLDERYPVSAGTDYAIVRLLIADDHRYKALQTLVAESTKRRHHSSHHNQTQQQEEERETENEEKDLFEEFLVRKRFREARALLERKDDETALLRAKFRADARIAVDTPWRAVRDKYLEDPLFAQLSSVDVLRAYEAHMQELEGAERAAWDRRDAKAKRECRRVRDAFRALLDERQRAGGIDMDTRWEDFAASVAGDDPRLLAFEDRDAYWGSRPQDLLADATGRMQGVYEEDEKAIYRTLDRIEAESGGTKFFVFRLASTLDGFSAFFRENGYEEVLARLRSKTSLAFFFNYNMKCLMEKRAKLVRTLAKLEKDLRSGDGQPLAFEDAAAKVLTGRSAFDSKTLSLEDKKAIYDEFMADPQKVLSAIPPEVEKKEAKEQKEKLDDKDDLLPPEAKRMKIEDDKKEDKKDNRDGDKKEDKSKHRHRHHHHHRSKSRDKSRERSRDKRRSRSKSKTRERDRSHRHHHNHENDNKKR